MFHSAIAVSMLAISAASNWQIDQIKAAYAVSDSFHVGIRIISAPERSRHNRQTYPINCVRKNLEFPSYPDKNVNLSGACHEK